MFAISQRLLNLHNKQLDASGLAVFRMAISAVLFWEVWQLFVYRHLIFDTIPFIEHANIDYKYALLVWLVVIIALFLGCFTRLVAILNYLLTLVFFASIGNFGNHMLNVFVAINFLLMFTALSQVWSLDAVIAKLRYPNLRCQRKVSVLNYYSLVFMALGLVYVVSLFDKFFTDYWQNGLVIWKFASVPSEFARGDLSILLNQKHLMQAFAYLALAFETLFIFICFNKRFRLLALFGGVFLHLGILICFPFSPFALGFLALYILLIPVRFWANLGHLVASKKPMPLYFQLHVKRSKFLLILVRSFDVFHQFQCVETDFNVLAYKQLNTKPLVSLQSDFNDGRSQLNRCQFVFMRLPFFMPFGLLLYVPVLGGFVFQVFKRFGTFLFVVVYSDHSERQHIHSKLLQRYKLKCISVCLLVVCLLQAHALLQTKFATYANLPSGIIQVHNMARVVFGIGKHSIFTHSTKQQQLFSIGITHITDTQKVWLPLTKPNGQADYYKVDPVRRKSFYSSKNSVLDSLRLNTYVRDYTAFWSFKQGVDLDSTTFQVYIKKLKIPDVWEKDVYRNNIEKPWISLGTVTWRDTLYTSQLNHLKTIH
tara:strand:+ start:1785 stop:3569 length:1785 start_codon:yes stop_codon:yes gene_type:complete